MKEFEYIAVSNLQRMRAAARLLRDCTFFEDDDLTAAINKVENSISVLENRVNKMCD